ncbi:MAG TPA: acyltransferase [Chitinophagaceae bacterium]|nr:acyltransferase [Chitinophagaceae bacterium]
MKSGDATYIPALTGVRFLAGFFVFLFHYKPLKSSDNPIVQQVVGVFNEMYTGVGLFFVLSGFLICYIYYQGASLKKDFLKNYFLRRFARIYPIFFLLTTAYFIYTAMYHGRADLKFLGIYFTNITLIKGFSQTLMFTGIFQTWSLTVEETFYFLAPLMFILHRKYGKLWWQVPVLISFGLLCVLIFSIIPLYGFFQDTYFLFMATFFGRCLEFFMGIQLALIVLRSGREKRASTAKFPVITALGISLLLLCLYGMSSIRAYFNLNYSVEHPLGLIVNNLVFPFTVAMFFYGLIYERSWVQRFFASKPVELLGKSSYAFYLIHAGFIAGFVFKLTNSNLYTFLLLEVLAISIFLLIERPLYRWITKAAECPPSPATGYYKEVLADKPQTS